MKVRRQSAGLLAFRRKHGSLEVFLVHMGGPFWQRKEAGAWSIPKGEFEDEAPLTAAMREFREETGLVPEGTFLALSPIRQSGGKTVHAFAVEWDCDPASIKSNTFRLEWPKSSGVMREFPEVDRAEWFTVGEARAKLVKGQVALIDELDTRLS